MVVPEAPNKTGGIVINFWTGKNYKSKYDINKKLAVREIIYEDGLQVTQKYSKIAGGELKKKLEDMGLDDTMELQKAFFVYELFAQRTGFPRLIPVEKSDKKPEHFEQPNDPNA